MFVSPEKDAYQKNTKKLRISINKILIKIEFQEEDVETIFPSSFTKTCEETKFYYIF